jgi:ribosomal protein S18 acetylase RimI-like enzyme
MRYEIRPVQKGDVWNIARLVHASRGLAGQMLEEQVERDVARFREQGLVEAIESETLIALSGAEFAGILRYGEFEEEVQLTRPDVHPAHDEREVAKALLQEVWTYVSPEVTKATYVDYPTRTGTLGDVFEAAGFSRWVDRLDMRIRLTKEVAPPSRKLTFQSFTEEVEDRFYEVYRQAFTGSLDPMMDWSKEHPKLSFEIFQTRYGEIDPDLWVLATDREGRDVGFAMYQYFAGGRYAGDTLLLYTGVAPDARGKGYGEEIVREGLRRVREKRGAAHAVSLSVTVTNLPAVNLYKRLGFRPTDKFSVYKMERSWGRNGRLFLVD